MSLAAAAAAAAAQAQPLAEHRRPTAEEQADKGDDGTFTRGSNSQAYLLRRLARDAPDVLERVKAGEFKSARADALLARLEQEARERQRAAGEQYGRGGKVGVPVREAIEPPRHGGKTAAKVGQAAVTQPLAILLNSSSLPGDLCVTMAAAMGEA